MKYIRIKQSHNIALHITVSERRHLKNIITTHKTLS